ncbi:ferredoxin [Phytohabitans rumicis]|uniref:Ferredoxin n=1 Tax=Phytohabitans rumicis TaxID=1076125 RepID=A0A6V8L7Y6_9ACTN|nr:ferredoxin [Phytohabitans rumicis]GFJ91660.1 hypothetical protein Prum_053020 [Phytohabitans rumicis]
MTEQWRVSVDPERCVASGMCAATAPGRFAIVDGVSRPISGLIDPDDAVVDAADMCPVEAIEVRTPTGHLIAPSP